MRSKSVTTMSIRIAAFLLTVFCYHVTCSYSTTALIVATPEYTSSVSQDSENLSSNAVVIRAKRQWGGFGCCPILPPICCLPPLLLPPPIPPPIFLPSCCGCCLPVCMPVCIAGGCGCGGGFFGRRKRSAIIQRNPVALRLTWSK